MSARLPGWAAGPAPAEAHPEGGHQTMPEEYERRVFVKDGREQICVSTAHEVSLRWSGWLPADAPAAANTPPAEEHAGRGDGASEASSEEPAAAKRTRSKTT